MVNPLGLGKAGHGRTLGVQAKTGSLLSLCRDTVVDDRAFHKLHTTVCRLYESVQRREVCLICIAVANELIGNSAE